MAVTNSMFPRWAKPPSRSTPAPSPAASRWGRKSQRTEGRARLRKAGVYADLQRRTGRSEYEHLGRPGPADRLPRPLLRPHPGTRFAWPVDDLRNNRALQLRARRTRHLRRHRRLHVQRHTEHEYLDFGGCRCRALRRVRLRPRHLVLEEVAQTRHGVDRVDDRLDRLAVPAAQYLPVLPRSAHPQLQPTHT